MHAATRSLVHSRAYPGPANAHSLVACGLLLLLLLLHVQVRRDASKALSEFKRTHEEDAIDTLKQLLGEEQWEALTQVTSSASYFV
jgi:hypothetical protein